MSDHEALATQIDTLDNLAHALTLPIPDALHVQALRESLPDLVKRMKAAYAALTGDDLWSDGP